MLKSNIQKIRENIEKTGKNPDDIILMGVTKTVPQDIICEAIELGITHLGENKVQEFLPKYEEISKNYNPTWHMIGHLQSNKVKFIVDKVKLIHSVDNLRLAEEINKRASQQIDVLIEINIANEDTKHGVTPTNALPLIEQMQTLPNICVAGLMCIAPYVENPEHNRKYFSNMYKLFIDIQNKKCNNTNMRFLSMGMSGDYAVAVEEGSNIVRIGSAMFGTR